MVSLGRLSWGRCSGTHRPQSPHHCCVGPGSLNSAQPGLLPSQAGPWQAGETGRAGSGVQPSHIHGHLLGEDSQGRRSQHPAHPKLHPAHGSICIPPCVQWGRGRRFSGRLSANRPSITPRGTCPPPRTPKVNVRPAHGPAAPAAPSTPLACSRQGLGCTAGHLSALPPDDALPWTLLPSVPGPSVSRPPPPTYAFEAKAVPLLGHTSSFSSGDRRALAGMTHPAHL